MMRSMKRCVALWALCALASVAPAAAQVVFTASSNAPPVAQYGDAEQLGSIRLTYISGATVAGTSYYFDFLSVPCDNSPLTGMSISVDNTYFVPGDVSFVAVPVTNLGLPAECEVVIQIAGGLPTVVPPANAAWVELDGVRGRLEDYVQPVGTNVYANVGALPASSATINNNQNLRVGVTVPILLTSTTTAPTQLVCLYSAIPPVIVQPTIDVIEGFPGIFVDYGFSPDHAGVLPVGFPPPIPPEVFPANLYGGNDNTAVRIRIYNLPTGVTLTFPAIVPGTQSLITFGGGYAAGGDELEVVPAYSTVVGGTANAYCPASTPVCTDVIYIFACATFTFCGTTEENWNIGSNNFLGNIVGLTLTTPTPGYGWATAQVEANPREVVPTPPFTTPPDIPGDQSRPRFSDPWLPVPPVNFVAINPCTTTLLFPFFASNIAHYDSSIAIANTSVDYTNAANLTGPPLLIIPVAPTPPESGTCELYGFPNSPTSAVGSALLYPIPNIPAGSTYAFSLSSTPLSGYEGYAIARCNFQYAHGLLNFVNNYGTTLEPTYGFGYVALVIPDPLVNVNIPSRPASPADTVSIYFGFNTNSGEGLTQ